MSGYGRTFGPSGANHSTGLVPDPGDTSHSPGYICDEHGIWIPQGMAGVRDGTTNVAPANVLNFTSGVTVTDAGGGVAQAAVDQMVGAGVGHRGGTVPDPGPTLHSPRYVFAEDGTYIPQASATYPAVSGSPAGTVSNVHTIVVEAMTLYNAGGNVVQVSPLQGWFLLQSLSGTGRSDTSLGPFALNALDTTIKLRKAKIVGWAIGNNATLTTNSIQLVPTVHSAVTYSIDYVTETVTPAGGYVFSDTLGASSLPVGWLTSTSDPVIGCFFDIDIDVRYAPGTGSAQGWTVHSVAIGRLYDGGWHMEKREVSGYILTSDLLGAVAFGLYTDSGVAFSEYDIAFWGLPHTSAWPMF